MHRLKDVIAAYHALSRSPEDERRRGVRRRPVAASAPVELPAGIRFDRRLRTLLFGKAHKPLDRRGD